MTRRFRLRRVSRLSPGEQLAPPTTTEAAVTARRTLLYPAANCCAPSPPTPAKYAPPVRAVELAEDRIEVVFTAPAPLPPNGWSTVRPSSARSVVINAAQFVELYVLRLVRTVRT